MAPLVVLPSATGNGSNRNPPALVALVDAVSGVVTFDIFALPFSHCFAMGFIGQMYVSVTRASLVQIPVLEEFRRQGACS